MSQLEDLVRHRPALLLAEAIGWLHDYTKCSEEHLVRMTSEGPELDISELERRFHNLLGLNVELGGDSRAFTHLLPWDRSGDTNVLSAYLQRCHKAAHFDKPRPKSLKRSNQRHPGVQVSSPFGFERDVPPELTSRLWQLPWGVFTQYDADTRKNVLKQVGSLFTQVGADTQWPINEVSLWDWGMSVGALYKAALAGTVLGHSPEAQELRWRLLSVRLPGLNYITNVVRLPDMLCRKQLLDDGLEKVRTLLEETYPLGSQIYRDENGALYVVPDIPDLLGLEYDGRTLLQIIQKEFAKGTLKNDEGLQIGGEITLTPRLEEKPWWGQDPEWLTKRKVGHQSNDEPPAIADLLSGPLWAQPDVAKVRESWEPPHADICTVCRLRPQGPDKKASERKVCHICEERRLDRSEQWAKELRDKTIWLDEVADINGRIALIVGQFDLKGWLDGTLVQSLVLNPPDSDASETKKSSFSRVRRIWDTTRQFWKETEEQVGGPLSGDLRPRMLFHLDRVPDLGPFHVYDLDLGPTTLSVVWYPREEGRDGYLISVDNLSYVIRQLGYEPNAPSRGADDLEWLAAYIKARPLILYNPDSLATERKQNLLDGWRIVKTNLEAGAYSAAISLLADPRVFMNLVPADKSLDVVREIKAKYEREMGKVCNRLPLHLGVIYFQRRTPLRAALDAGREMLLFWMPASLWSVQSVGKGGPPPSRPELTVNNKQFEETITVELTREGKRITWHVPNRMGDGKTADSWYPYVFLETNGDSNKIGGRPVRATIGNGSTSHLIHAQKLREGDQVWFAPSSFDFEFLDTAARRFEIDYNTNGRRPRSTRPFYLEDLDRFDELWRVARKLKSAQLHQVIHTIEATREAWYGSWDTENESMHDGVFKQFVADTLGNANWPKDDPWGKISRECGDRLIEAGVNGALADLAELHMEILKER